MSQRTALFIAAALTAIVLFVGGAVAGNATRLREILVKNNGTPPSTVEIAADENIVTAQDTSDTFEVLLERDAAYQELINQANIRLQAAYADDLAKPTNVSTGITAEQAAGIVIQSYPDGLLLNSPRLVSFQGSAAFEVSLLNGTVYVSAATGEILYSTIYSAPAAQPTYYGSGGGNGSMQADTNSGSQGDDGQQFEDDEDHEEGEGEHEQEHEEEHIVEPEGEVGG